MSNLSIAAGSVKGLRPEDQNKLADLVNVLNYHQEKNGEKSKYYEGHVPLSDVNLGIALPKELMGLEIGCEWGAKCVAPVDLCSMVSLVRTEMMRLR